MILKLLDKGRFLLLCTMFWLINVQIGVAQPELVKDINASGSGFRGSEIVVFKGAMYFRGDDGTSGVELWKSDGTPGGTVLVKDINPGTASSAPEQLTVAGDYLFFGAITEDEGGELWRTDGTSDGTQIVADLLPGANTPRPAQLTAANDKLFFEYPDPDLGRILYVVSGTGDPQRLTEEGFSEIAALGDKVYFRARLGSSGIELYTSDGTVEGTELVKDIWRGSSNSRPENLTPIDNLLYLAAEDPRGVEPWISDGTAAGTQLLKDLYTDQDADPDNFTKVGDLVFFSANEDNSELWTTDGTTENTNAVIDLNSANFNRELGNFTAGDGILYFSANTDAEFRELWRSDGTTEGTYMVKDINPGRERSIDTDDDAWLYYNERLYFLADDGTNGRELWVSDGTEEGTQLVDINEGSGNSAARLFTEFNNEIYFAAFTSTTGTELYKYKPTNAPPPSNTITGFVYEFNINDTNDQSNRLQGVTVTNLFTSETATTNDNGEYEIAAEDGHEVRFTKTGYTPFRLLTNFVDDGTVYNIPLTAQGSNITFNFDPNVLNENEPIGTVAGRFTSKDFDNLTYSLISGEGDTDNGSFTINDQGELITQFSPDFETKNSYSIRVRAANGTDNPAEESFTISITDVNEISGFVYQFDSNDSDNTSQRVEGVSVRNLNTDVTTQTNNNGEYELEAENGHEIRFFKEGYDPFLLTTNFGSDGTTYNIPLTAQLSNIFFSFNPNTLNENDPVGTVAGTFTSSDFDNLTYSFISGEGDADNGSFTINDQGELITQFSPDFETKNSYSIRVRAANGTDNPAEESFTITVNDVNEPLTGISINPDQINSAFSGGLLTTLSVTDPENKNDAVYSFVAGNNDNGLFFIDGNQVFASPEFSVDNRDEIVLEIQATDEFGEGLSIEERFVIAIVEVASLQLIVSPADGNFCTGEEISFSIDVLNAANEPSVIWFVNGQQAAPNDVDLRSGDQVEIRVTAIDAADQQQKTISSGVIEVKIGDAPPATITSYGFIITASAGTTYEWYYQGELLPDTTQSIIAKQVGEYQVAVISAEGCTSMSEPLYMFVTDLDNKNNIEAKVYPNPVTDKLHLKFSTTGNKAEVWISDLTGREILHEKITRQFSSFATEGWRRGIYLIKIQISDKEYHFKLLKK